MPHVIHLRSADFDYQIEQTDPEFDPVQLEQLARNAAAVDFHLSPVDSNYVFRRFNGRHCYLGGDPIDGNAEARDQLRRVVLVELAAGRTANDGNDVRLPTLTTSDWLVLPNGVHQVFTPVNRHTNPGEEQWTHTLSSNGTNVGISRLRLGVQISVLYQISVPPSASD